MSTRCSNFINFAKFQTLSSSQITYIQLISTKILRLGVSTTIQLQAKHSKPALQIYQYELSIYLYHIKGQLFYSNVQYLKQQIYPILMILFSIGTLTALALITLTFQKISFQRLTSTNDLFEQKYYVSQNDQKYFLTVSCKDQNILSLSISLSKKFTQAPAFDIFGENVSTKMGRESYTFLKYCQAFVQVTQRNIVQISREQNGQIIFSLSNLTISSKHNWFTVFDDSKKWGFGERFQSNFHMNDGKWTIWNRDRPWQIDNGKGGGQQSYGHHPIYLAQERSNNLFHLTYFKNTHGLAIEASKNTSQIIYHSLGGNIHFLIFIGGEDPEKLLQNYHEYIGPSHIAPFWSFGYHQSRWGYKSFSELQEVVRNFNDNLIPIDAIWSDLEYMDEKVSFTVSKQTHPPQQMNKFFNQEKIHFIPLIDAGISFADIQGVKLGKQMNIFLKSQSSQTQLYVGEVWAGITFFVDFLHPNATEFWKKQLNRLYNQIQFSGIWLDMNQPSNFRGGEWTEQPFKIQPNEPLNQMTISSDLIHYNRRNRGVPLYHKQVHAYYGHLSTIPTFQFLKTKGRPFIITRSTSVGTGSFAGHWTGDNQASWDFLRLSVSGNFLFQIFGMHIVGADICGFHQDTTQELCARWFQVGTFYPFARNHNHHDAKSQEPYALGNSVLQTAKACIKTRYALLKQLYTFYLRKRGVGSFYRPLFFQFYNDSKAYDQEVAETQILIGDFLMTTPILYEGFKQRQVYFPGSTEDLWYRFQINISTGQIILDKIKRYQGGTKQIILNDLPNPPPTFLRGGYMLLTNQPQTRSHKLTREFCVFATIRENISKGYILAIPNFNNNTQIEFCLKDQCTFQIIIIKIGSQTFKVEWKYLGDEANMSPIILKTFIILNDNKKWQSSQSLAFRKTHGIATIQGQQVS